MRRVNAALVALMLAIRASAQAAPAAPPLPATDRVRILEAHHVAGAVADSVWPTWGAAPFAMLLITPRTEFLVDAPAQGSGWSAVPYDTLLGALIHSRARQFAPQMQATFPFVNGINTIVIGQPELTSDKTSSRWVITVMHEHFHQWVYSQPWYYAKLATLGLDHGDKTGMWMLNYPFPYDSAEVGRRFKQMAHALRSALAAPEGASRAQAIAEYRDARDAFRATVPPEALTYFEFQLWQEGVARYTEVAVCRALVRAGYVQTPAFAALSDARPYSVIALSILAGVNTDLDSLDLARDRRTVVYSLGAAQAMLLDITRPAWRAQYLTQPFRLPDP
jgi:hypothetical protein